MLAFGTFRLRLLAVFGTLAIVSGSFAEPPATSSGTTTTGGKAGKADTTLKTAISTLQKIKVTLENANHDYGGHRAAAVKEIGAAEHQLRLANRAAHEGKKSSSSTTEQTKPAATSKPAASSSSTGGNGGGKETEPQAMSNEQLAQSIPQLEGAVNYLKSAGHDFGGHKEKAIEDLTTAIKQLQNALEYAKKKDANKP